MKGNNSIQARRFSQTTQELISLLSSLSEEKLNEKLSDTSWTAAQVGDHLWKSYAVVQTLNGKVKPTDREPDEKIAEVEELFLNFNIKMESPEAILPTSEYIKKEELLDRLQERLLQLQEVFQHKDLSVTCMDYAIPEYGDFTRLEWLVFNTVHTERHVHQLKHILYQLEHKNQYP